MKSILITGVSSGIGWGAAKAFVEGGYRVFGSVRKAEDARRLADEFGPGFIPLQFDVTDGAALKRAAQAVAAIAGSRGLGGIVNNAGMATSGPLAYQSIDEIRWQFEVNVIAPMAVIQTFLPLLKTGLQTGSTSPSVPRRIINISSVGGKVAAPFIGAYAGSKHALEGLSHSLRRELQLCGIDVVIIGPGAVNTPIWQKASAQDMGPYAETEYGDALRAFQRYSTALGQAGYPPDRVGAFIKAVFERRRPRARYAIVPNPIPNWFLPRAMPDRWLDWLIGMNFGLRPKG